MHRKFEEKIDTWSKNKNKKPLVVIGVRQSGESYIIDKYCRENYKKYTKINLFEDSEFIKIYNDYETYSQRIEMLKYNYNIDFEDKDTLLFVDEAQKCPLLIQDLKLFCEDGISNIIVAGSLLSIEIRDMDYSYPVGKAHEEFLNPMNFEEFLIATGNENYIKLIKDCFINNKTCVAHDKLMNLYCRYLFNGGMPELLQNYIDNDMDISKTNYEVLSDISDGYSKDIDKHIGDAKEKLRVKNIYDNIAPQLMKENPKFMYAKLDDKSKKGDYIFALDWLINSHMVIKCNQLTKPEYPIAGFIDQSFIYHPIKNKEKIGVPSIESSEFKFAIWIKNNFGGDIHMVPVINTSKGNYDTAKTKTPDYIWNNEKWDLKEINGSSKNTIIHKFYEGRNQSDNLFLLKKESCLPDCEIIDLINQALLIYKKYYKKVIFISDTKIFYIENNKSIHPV